MFWEKYQHDQYLLVYEILELKKKKFPKGSTTCSLRHYYGSLACPFSFLGLGVEVLFTSLRCGPMVLVLILGVGLKFETQPQVTM